MKQQLAEVDAIANQTAPRRSRTRSSQWSAPASSSRARRKSSTPSPRRTPTTRCRRFRKIIAPKLAAHNDAIYLNDKLFQRVKSIYDRRDALGLNAEQKFLVELYYRNFVRAGAQLSEADKTKLRALNQEESKLTTDFSEQAARRDEGRRAGARQRGASSMG